METIPKTQTVVELSVILLVFKLTCCWLVSKNSVVHCWNSNGTSNVGTKAEEGGSRSK